MDSATVPMPTASPRQQMRILIQRDPRSTDWIARFKDDPNCHYRSASPEAALNGLLRRNPHKLPPHYGVAEVESNYWKGLIEAVVFAKTPCPDCNGTGKYVGLNVIEACATCAGTGSIRN